MIAGLGRKTTRILQLVLAIATPGLFLSTCATHRTPDASYMKDGVAYGVTEGPFRGRWWNYYERGRSFQEGGFLEEAAADFRVAMQSRRKDGLWPRTYGMHFIPEYFPHRELGINLFLQGDLEGSVAELETSLAQQYSARAADYFEQVQRKLVESSGRDSMPPTLEITTKRNGLSATQITLEGVARDDTFVAAVDVAGIPYDIRVIGGEIPFQMEVLLAPGENTIPVTVVDLAGKSYTTEIVLENDLDGPAISFDEPISLPGAVTGVIFDPAGIDSLKVNDIAARLTEKGNGIAQFEVSLNEFVESFTFDGRDKLGNSTHGDYATAASTAPVSVASTSGAVAAELLAATRQGLTGANGASANSVELRLTNIEGGEAFYQDEIVVALRAEATEPIRKLSLLGTPLDIVPARRRVTISRKVPLDFGDNEVAAEAEDISGNQANVKRVVLREENQLEVSENRLAIAFIPRNDTPDIITNFILTALPGTEARINATSSDAGHAEIITLTDRFQIVDRSVLEDVLTEQTLAAERLTSRENSIALGQMTAAEVLFEVIPTYSNGHLEIILRGYSTETGLQITGNIDVAGFAQVRDDGETYFEEPLLEQLVLRLLQEFPRAHGDIFKTSGKKFYSTLNYESGSRDFRKCVVYTIDNAGGFTIPEVEGEGHITGVDRDQGFSVGIVTESLLEGVLIGDFKLREDHHVVLK